MLAWLEHHQGGSVLSMFIVAEDANLIPEAGGRLMQQAAMTAHPSESIRVRVHMASAAAAPGNPRGIAETCIVPCLANAQLLTNHNFGAADTWFGMELTPLQVDMVDVARSERSGPTQSAGSVDPHSAADVAEQLGSGRVGEDRGEGAGYDERSDVDLLDACLESVEQQLMEALLEYAEVPSALDGVGDVQSSRER